MGKIKDKKVKFLVDSGATHNYIDLLIVQRLGLETVEVDTLK